MVSLAELQCSISSFHDGITFYTKHIYSVGSLDKISSVYNGYSYKWKSAVGLEWDAMHFWTNKWDFNPPPPPYTNKETRTKSLVYRNRSWSTF